MRGIRRILIKDLRTNWLFWGAALAANGLFAYSLYYRSISLDSSRDLSWLLGLAEALALAIGVVSLVQADGPANPLGDWRIRPVNRGDVLLAKVIALLAVIVLPRFLIGTVAGGLFQLTALEAAAASGLHLVADIVVLTLCFGLAAITRDLSQTAIVGGLFLVVAALSIAWLERVANLDGLTAGMASLALVCALGIGALYAGWKPQATRSFLAIAGLVWIPASAGVALGLAALQSSSPVAAETALTRQVSIRPVLAKPYQVRRFDLGPYDEGRYLPYSLSRPENLGLVNTGVRLTLTSQSGQVRHLPALRPSEYGLPMGEPVLGGGDRMVHIGAMGSGDPGGQLTVEVDYRAYRRLDRQPLPIRDGALHRVAGVGGCALTGGRKEGSTRGLICFSADYPPCLSDRSAPDTCPPKGWRRLIRWPLPFAQTQLGSVDSKGPGPFTWTEEGRFTRRMVLNAAEIDRWAVTRKQADEQGLVLNFSD